MRIWLDCSSLMDWKFSHLTGIQRTVLGIHKGWKACGIEPRLFRYHPGIDGFVLVEIQELPEVIRLNLERQEWISIASVDNAYKEAAHKTRFLEVPLHTAKSQSLKRRIGRRVLGHGASADAMRQAISEVNLSLWRLWKAFRDWISKRLHLKAEQGMAARLEANKCKGTDSEKHPICVEEGDFLFSIGSECYQMPESLRAARALKRQGAKVIRMIYDLIPAYMPQWSAESDAINFTRAIREVLLTSDYILTISEWSLKDILSFANEQGIPPPPVSPIRLGDELPTDNGAIGLEPKEDQLPTRPFFLCLGTMEPRKNHRLLYKVWRKLAVDNPKDCPDLVCIGALNWLCAPLVYEMAHDPLVKSRILVLQNVNDNQLEWFYQHCIATIFPSLYEGWGLPVAESLARGKLCLASNATSIPEISGLPAFFDPCDESTLVSLIKRAVDSPVWREKEEEQIRAIFKKTTWKETALDTLKRIKELP